MEKEKHSGRGRGVTFLFLGFLGVLSLLSIVTPQKAFFRFGEPVFTEKTGIFGEIPAEWKLWRSMSST